MKKFAFLFALGFAAVAQSQTAVVNYRVTDLTMYGIGERHAIFYGATPNTTGTVRLGTAALPLTRGGASAVQGVLSFPDALQVAGKPTLALPAPRLTAMVVFKTSQGLRLITRVPLGSVYYYTGGRWNTLSRTAAGQENMAVTPTPRNSLFGAGQLTQTEATALGRYLTSRNAEVIVANVGNAPSAAALRPAPQGYRSTTLYVQLGLRDASNVEEAAAALFSGVDIISSGSQSAYSDAAMRTQLVTNPEDYEVLWRTVAGNQVPLPDAPAVDFTQNKLVAVFMGQKMSGGYGLRFVSAVQRRGDLRILLEPQEPKAGTVQTQALTSPYLLLAVDPSVTAVEVKMVEKK
jgi:hypothetical protein